MRRGIVSRALVALTISGTLVVAGCGSEQPSPTPASSTSLQESTPPSPTESPSPAADASTPSTLTNSLPTTKPEGYSVQLVAAGTTAYVSVDAVQALPQVTIDTPDAGMAQQSGATLRSVLESAGVDGFDAVTITGPRGATTVRADALVDTMILGVTKRQTLRFSGQDLDMAQWVQDVTDIEVS